MNIIENENFFLKEKIKKLEKELVELRHKAQQIDALFSAEKACDALKINNLQKEVTQLQKALLETTHYDVADYLFKKEK